MEWIEVTGRTVEEALDAALDELGVDEDDVEYEVLDAPKRGFFGLRAATVRIRARVKPISREKPDRRRRSGPRSEGGGGGRGGRGRERSRAKPASQAGPGRADRGDREETARNGGDEEAGERAAPARAPQARGSGGQPAGPGEASEGAASQKRSRQRRRGPRREPGASSPRGEEENAVSGTDVSLDEQVELAESFTRGLIERFGMPATVSARADGDDDVVVDVQGDDLGLLIGPRASTLDAVQELVRTAVQRRIGGHGARVHVDVGGYRARRQEALAEFARQAAQRAIESGRDQVFEPMSPGDRKVVHDTVNEIEGVATVSEGEEPRRRVVIKAL